MHIWDDDYKIVVAIKEIACYLICMGAMFILFRSMETLPGFQGEEALHLSDLLGNYGLQEFIEDIGYWDKLCVIPISNKLYMWLSLYPLVVLISSVACYFFEIGMVSKALREYSEKITFILLLMCMNGLVDLLMYPFFVVGNLIVGIFQLLFRRR